MPAVQRQRDHVRVARATQVHHEELAQAPVQSVEELLDAVDRRQPAHLLSDEGDHVQVSFIQLSAQNFLI